MTIYGETLNQEISRHRKFDIVIDCIQIGSAIFYIKNWGNHGEIEDEFFVEDETENDLHVIKRAFQKTSLVLETFNNNDNKRSYFQDKFRELRSVADQDRARAFSLGMTDPFGKDFIVNLIEKTLS